MPRPILVTGAHRSGSTWVGNILSSAPRVRYIHEPFNVALGRLDSPFRHWFEHVSSESDQRYQAKVKDFLMSFIRPTISPVFEARSLKSAGRAIAEMKRRITDRTLFKDPIAVMSTEWIYENLDCDVVVLIRHPAAFVASLAVKGWLFDFRDLQAQSSLVDRHLPSLRADIDRAAAGAPDIVEQGIILWNAIYGVVLRYQGEYSDRWYFITHESLSREPMKEYEKMFRFLNLSFSARVKRTIVDTTSGKEVSKWRRNSSQNTHSWQKRLSPDQVERIRKGTYPLWTNWYTDSDWAVTMEQGS